MKRLIVASKKHAVLYKFRSGMLFLGFMSKNANSQKYMRIKSENYRMTTAIMKSASTNEKSTCGKQKFFYLKLSDNTQYDAEIREKI